MQDELAIQRLINTYSHYGSLGDWDMAVGTYAENGVWEIPHFAMRFEGHAAIRQALTDFFATMDYVVQLNSPALIDVSGDTATARSNIHEGGKVAGEDQGFLFLGYYDDELVRTDAGWKFIRRRFVGTGSSIYTLIKGEKH
ncbi:MAG: nuclear transport factor 2 family protein [Novosphingobium sp.]